VESLVDGVSLLCHLWSNLVVGQVAQVLNNRLRVRDEIRDQSGVHFVVPDELIVVRFNRELIILHNCPLPQYIFTLSWESFHILFGVNFNAVVQMLWIYKPGLMNNMLVSNPRTTIGRHKYVRVVVFWEIMRRQLNLIAFVLYVTLLKSNHKIVVFHFQIESEIFLIGVAILEFMSFNKLIQYGILLLLFTCLVLPDNHRIYKILVLFIMDVHIHWVDSRGRSFLLVGVPLRTLSQMNLDAIVVSVKTMAEFTCTFHRVVSENEESEVSTSHRWSLLVGNWQINFKFEVLKRKCIFGVNKSLCTE